jgi:hypothetical protein
MKIPKKSLSILAISAASLNASAQSTDRPHVAKLNVLGLVTGTFSAQYEHALPGKFSFAAAVNLRPAGKVPMRGFFNDFVDVDDSISNRLLQDSRASHFAITPEVRYYFGRRPLTGFYTALYARYASSAVSVDYTYTSGTDVYPVSLNARGTSVGAGVLLGAQFSLSQRIVVDWWMAGASINRTSFDVNGRANLSEVSEANRESAKEVIESKEVFNGAFDATITDHGGSAVGKLTLPGFRTGLCIGVRF